LDRNFHKQGTHQKLMPFPRKNIFDLLIFFQFTELLTSSALVKFGFAPIDNLAPMDNLACP
jgi:hypothetical protein